MPSLIQHAEDNTGLTNTVVNLSFGSSTTSGNTIFVAVSNREGATGDVSFVVTDNKGNTYSSAEGSFATGGAFSRGIQLFYCQNITGGSSHQITVTPSGTDTGAYLDTLIFEFDGIVSSPLDQHTLLIDQFGTNPTSGATGTLSQADELVISVGYIDAGTTVDAGYTLGASVVSAGTNLAAWEYKVVSSTSPVTGSWINAANGSYTVLVATFKAVSATIEQEGHLWRSDNGSETTATPLAAQDANITQPVSTNTRLRTLLNATNDPASIAYRLEWNRTAYDSIWRAVGAAAGNIVFGAIGTVGTGGTTSITAAYPTGIVAGSALICSVASRPETATVSTPAGWTALSNNSFQGTGGAEAADAGSARITVFVKEADGTESGSLTIGLASSPNAAFAQIVRYEKGTAKLWQFACNGGSFTAGSTAWSVTAGGDPGIANGDYVVTCSAANTDTPTYTSGALTATGVTFSGNIERADNGITTGNDMHMTIHESICNSGTSSAAPVFTMTASSGTPEGGSVMLRIRQVDAPITLGLSGNIAAGGVATTAQLTAPSGKSTSDFVTGRMWDNENGLDSIDITVDDYTELEWCLVAGSVAANGDIYQFRVTNAGTALDTYTVTPVWTIGSAVSVFMGWEILYPNTTGTRKQMIAF